MSLFFRGVLLVTALILAGCTGFKTTKEDQIRSLQEFNETNFSAPLRFAELNNAVVEQTNPRTFLQITSSGIYATADTEVYGRLEKIVTLIGEGKNDEAKALEEKLVIQGAATQGSGIAITDDGYIVTAAHVVRHPNLLVMNVGLPDGSATVQHARPRVVFADEKADFALLKCDLATPRFLMIAPEAVSVGTTMFSGGWFNQSGAGRLLNRREFRTQTSHKYVKLRSSVPMLPGDSGSAVIDTSGRLLGVTITWVSGRFMKIQTKSEAVMLDPTELQRLIEEDRAKPR